MRRFSSAGCGGRAKARGGAPRPRGPPAPRSPSPGRRPRWGRRRLDEITVDDAAVLVRELRLAGKAEWTIATILRAAGRVFAFARRRLRWHGENPVSALEASERPKVTSMPRRRIFQGDE